MSSPEALKEKRFAMQLSLWVGVGMFILKSFAYWLTGSSAIFSDAAESVVHVIAVAFAAYSLWLSIKPADKEHRYGHSKISFFSAGFEGAMIMIAAIFIIYQAISKWLAGLHLQNLDTGIVLTAAALLINGLLGMYLVLTGKKRSSLILTANGKHVLTDAWTSLGVVLGVTLTWLTGWLPLDPICAIAVAIQILVTGVKLVKESVIGLMDTADPEIDKTIRKILDAAIEEFDIQYHNVKHMNTGDGYRIEMHLLFEDSLTIRQAHGIASTIEERIRQSISLPTQVSTHLEPRREHELQHAYHE